MMMRATQILAFVLIAVRVHGTDAPTEIYLNPHHGFSVSIPADWERIDDRGNECKAMFLLPKDGTVSFAGVTLEKGVDLAQFEEQSMRQPKPEMLINLLGVRNFKLLSSKSAELAKVKARFIEYTALYEGLEYKGCLYLAISNGRGFLLRFQAPTDLYPSQKDAFLKTAQSFKVNTPDGRDHSEFSNKKLGYSLKYPATWYSFTMIQGTHVFCAPQNVGGEVQESIVIITTQHAAMSVAENHVQFVRQSFEELSGKPGMSEGDAPTRTALGNMQGFRYAITQTRGKNIARQECYSAVKGTRNFTVICTAPAAKAAGARAVFDGVLKSLRADDVPVQIVEYKSERNGFSIGYPDNWTTSEPMPWAFGVAIPKRVAGTENLFEAMGSVRVDSVDSKFDLERVAVNEKNNFATEQGYHLEEEKHVELNGLAARRQINTWIFEKVKVRTLRYIILGRRRQFVVEFISPVAPFGVYLKTFEQIAASFKLLPVPNEGESYYLHKVHASLHFPANWEVREDDKSDRASILLNREKLNKKGLPEVLVSVDIWQEKSAPEMTLQAFTKSTLDELIREQKDAKVGEKSDLKIDGHEAVETHLTADTPLGAKRLVCYTVLAHGMCYFIIGSGLNADFQKHSKTIDEIVQSIQFDEPLPEPPVFTEEPVKKLDDWKLFEKTFIAIRDYLAEGEIMIPSDILRQAELGDHFETINLDRPDSHSAFGNPDAHWFHLIKGSDKPDNEFGSYGRRDGGGRCLMVPQLSCDFSKAIMDCAHTEYEKKVTATATKEQALELAKQIELLISADIKQHEAASNALLKSGMTAVNLLIDALKDTKESEIQLRIRGILQKIHLRAAVDKFRLDHPAKDDKVSPKK